MTSATPYVKSAGCRRALIPDDGHEDAFHRLKQQQTHDDEEEADTGDRRPHGPILFEHDPVEDRGGEVSPDQHGRPGGPVIGPDFAPIHAARRAVFDGLQERPEEFGFAAIGALHLQPTPDFWF